MVPIVKVAFATALGLTCAVLSASPAVAADFSDTFAGRETLSGLPVQISGSNLGATTEAGDPQEKPFAPGPSFHPAGHGIWVEWEATADGYVTVSLCGSEIVPVLGIYHGLDPIALGHWFEQDAGTVAHGPGCEPIEGGITFRAFAGVKYELFVDGDAVPVWPGPREGAVSMRIEATPRPPNDDFANAAALSAPFDSNDTYSAWKTGYTWAATKEPGEPAHGADAAGASVWYQWTAPKSGDAQIGLGESSTRFAVYRGENIGSLERVLSGPEYGVLSAVGGITYRIAVDAPIDELGPQMDIFVISVWMYASARTPRDRRPPRTTIVSRKVHSRTRSVTIRFRSNETASQFHCKLDRGKPRKCRPPKTYAGLVPGRHTFRVFAVDASGNADPTPAVSRFTIAPLGVPHRHMH